MSENIYAGFGISDEVFNYGQKALEGLSEKFAAIDRTAEYNQAKVLSAMQKCRVSSECMNGTTGYGYGDIARETLESVYATLFKTEDALVRPQITCGTHALALALSAVLRPGDRILAPAGGPYDTLYEVIGIRESTGSLAEFGIGYSQVDLREDGSFDYPAIEEALKDESIRLCEIQRSKGYQMRPSFSVDSIGELISFIRERRPDVICMVDNCYGEFIETKEPSEVGADMTVGSLIKNPGGGIAPIGGYIAGRSDLIEKCAVRLTAPGLGKEVGASLDVMRSLYQGLFLAPAVSAGALKGAIFAARLYEGLGYNVVPSSDSFRTDIIQAVELGTPEALCAFCEGIQAAAPVDSHVRPEAWDMPGYEDQVIMAAGAFVSGSSIELSADGPMRSPYAVYFQGGLTWYHARFGILMSLQKLYEANLVKGTLLC